MPCMCWFEPRDSDKKEFKNKCQDVVSFIKDMEKIGDPLGISLQGALSLIEHLYTGKCYEKNDHPSSKDKKSSFQSMTNSQMEQFLKDTNVFNEEKEEEDHIVDSTAMKEEE